VCGPRGAPFDEISPKFRRNFAKISSFARNSEVSISRPRSFFQVLRCRMAHAGVCGGFLAAQRGCGAATSRPTPRTWGMGRDRPVRRGSPVPPRRRDAAPKAACGMMCTVQKTPAHGFKDGPIPDPSTPDTRCAYCAHNQANSLPQTLPNQDLPRRHEADWQQG
jgi:hypothetical protein